MQASHPCHETNINWDAHSEGNYLEVFLGLAHHFHRLTATLVDYWRAFKLIHYLANPYLDNGVVKIYSEVVVLGVASSE